MADGEFYNLNNPDVAFDSFLDAMQQFSPGNVSLELIASENKNLLKTLTEFDPLLMASTFSGLLVEPALQSNCLRLELLVHLSLSSAHGKRKPNAKIVSRLFNKLGEGWAGRYEDPAEDVFVSSIATPRGNYRILEGIWESAGFYLQRVVNIVETLPHAAYYDWIRESVYALLRLSDTVCERTQLTRNQLGNPIPLDELPQEVLNSLGSLRSSVSFSEADLKAIDVSVEHLAEFGFDPAPRSNLKKETIGHSTLERFPVAHRNGEFFFLLPTSMSAAIRRYVFEKLGRVDLREALIGSLDLEYTRLFSATHLLGGQMGAPIIFRRTEHGLLAGVLEGVDRGRYVNFVFFIDTLEGFESTGLIGTNPNPTQLADDIERCIDKSYESACEISGFCGMLTLLVGCGIGRREVYCDSNKKRENWRFECLSAPDLLTLSWVPEFKPLSLWRLLETQERVQALGVELQNVNGLLNLVAWGRLLGGHLVPHGEIPDNFCTGDVENFVAIEQNALRHLRHEVAVLWDTHVAIDVHGRWLQVRKKDRDCLKKTATYLFM